MRQTANAGDTLSENDTGLRREPLKAALHATMLEEQMGMVVDDQLPRVIKGEFRRFHDIRPHRAEGQDLNIRASQRPGCPPRLAPDE